MWPFCVIGDVKNISYEDKDCDCCLICFLCSLRWKTLKEKFFGDFYLSKVEIWLRFSVLEIAFVMHRIVVTLFCIGKFNLWNIGKFVRSIIPKRIICRMILILMDPALTSGWIFHSKNIKIFSGKNHLKSLPNFLSFRIFF